MAFGLKLPLHGRTHDPDRGSDPIPIRGLGWRFNKFNGDQSEGETHHGWGVVMFDDSIDHTQGELGGLFEDMTGQGIMLISHGTATYGKVLVDGDTARMIVSSGLGVVIDEGAAQMNTNLTPAGATYVINDSSNVPIVTWTG